MRRVAKIERVPAPKTKPKISPSEQREQEAKRKAVADFTHERTRAMRIKRMQSEMILGKARNELIAKDLVEKQAADLLVAMRQRVLQLPQTYARRILNVSDVEKARKILTTAAHQLLAELQDLPKKMTDPNFLRRLEEEETGGGGKV